MLIVKHLIQHIISYVNISSKTTHKFLNSAYKKVKQCNIMFSRQKSTYYAYFWIFKHIARIRLFWVLSHLKTFKKVNIATWRKLKSYVLDFVGFWMFKFVNFGYHSKCRIWKAEKPALLSKILLLKIPQSAWIFQKLEFSSWKILQIVVFWTFLDIDEYMFNFEQKLKNRYSENLIHIFLKLNVKSF